MASETAGALESEFDEDSGWLRQMGPGSHRALRRTAPGLATIPTALVLDAIDLANELGTSRVFYLSREGLLLHRVHQALRNAGYTNLDSTHLQVSRLAVCLPAMLELTRHELMNILRLYPVISLSTLFDSMGISVVPAEVRWLADRAGSSWDQPVAWHDSPDVLDGVLRASPVQQMWVEAHGRARRSVMQYLDEQQFIGDSVVVSDLGWRGTLQDMLSRITGIASHGQYLALFEYLNPQSILVAKNATLWNQNHGDDVSWLSDSVSALERLCTAPVPTTEAYDKDGMPVLHDDMRFTLEGADGAQWVLHQAMVDSAAELAAAAESSAFGRQVIRDAAAAVARVMVFDPPPIVALTTATQSHDERFGEGNRLADGRLRRSWPAGARALSRWRP